MNTVSPATSAATGASSETCPRSVRTNTAAIPAAPSSPTSTCPASGLRRESCPAATANRTSTTARPSLRIGLSQVPSVRSAHFTMPVGLWSMT